MSRCRTMGRSIERGLHFHKAGTVMNDGAEEGGLDESEPKHTEVSHNPLSARVPESLGPGVFSNGVMVLSGNHEFVLDFVLRLAKPERIVARVVLPIAVTGQLIQALQANLKMFEERFGTLPMVPKPLPEAEQSGEESGEGAPKEPGIEGVTTKSTSPSIAEIYDELRMPDDMLSGRYANAVLIRHSGTEFCFDFITTIYPRSAVSSRVFLATPHVRPFLTSLEQAFERRMGQ